MNISTVIKKFKSCYIVVNNNSEIIYENGNINALFREESILGKNINDYLYEYKKIIEEEVKGTFLNGIFVSIEMVCENNMYYIKIDSINYDSYLSYLFKISDQVSFSMYWLDRELRIIGYNNKFKEFIEDKDYRGRKISETPFASKRGAEINKAILKDGKTYNELELTVTKNGDNIYYKHTKTPNIINGEIVGIIGIMFDITKEKTLNIELNDTKNLLELVIEHIPAAVGFTDKDANIIGSNKEFDKFLIETNIEDYNMGKQQELKKRNLDTIKKGITFKDEFMMLEINEKKRYYKVFKGPLYTNGKINGLVAIIEDRTEIKEYQNRVIEYFDRITNIINTMPISVYWKDKDNRYVGANEKFLKFIKKDSVDSIIGKTNRELFSKKIEDVFIKDDIVVLSEGKKLLNVEHKFNDEYGNCIYLRTSKLPLYENGVVSGFMGLIEDITKTKNLENSLREKSYLDDLTGLNNRNYYEEKLIELNESENDQIYIIIIIDVNGLKLFNDAFGHFSGDESLKKIAEALKNSIRLNDILCRIGGDEFAIIIKNFDRYKINEFLQRIDSNIKNKKVKGINLSASIGYAISNEATGNINQLIIEADNNMYENKEENKEKNIRMMIDGIITEINRNLSGEKEHSDKVSCYSAKIGKLLGLSNSDQLLLKKAGFYHDIGKIAIDKEIIEKKGELTKKEWKEVRKHSGFGGMILKSSKDFNDIADIVLYHHERYDGKGYPKGVKGKEIPYFARIVIIADAISSMSSIRPYRGKLSKDEIINELKMNMNTQFDPEIAKVVVEYLEKNDLCCESEVYQKEKL